MKNLPSQSDLYSESAVSMHVVGMLVQAWSIDVQVDARSTLSVLANFMSSQARILFPTCPSQVVHLHFLITMGVIQAVPLQVEPNLGP